MNGLPFLVGTRKTYSLAFSSLVPLRGGSAFVSSPARIVLVSISFFHLSRWVGLPRL